jgi:hypothetical protein
MGPEPVSGQAEEGLKAEASGKRWIRRNSVVRWTGEATSSACGWWAWIKRLALGAKRRGQCCSEQQVVASSI